MKRALVTTLVCTSLGLAQDGARGRASGRVVDESTGAPISGARVELDLNGLKLTLCP